MAIGSLGCQLRQLAAGSGGSDHRLETALTLGHIALRMEQDDIDLWKIEKTQRDGGAEAERDSQRSRLDVHLREERVVSLCLPVVSI